MLTSRASFLGVSQGKLGTQRFLETVDRVDSCLVIPVTATCLRSCFVPSYPVHRRGFWAAIAYSSGTDIASGATSASCPAYGACSQRLATPYPASASTCAQAAWRRRTRQVHSARAAATRSFKVGCPMAAAPEPALVFQSTRWLWLSNSVPEIHSCTTRKQEAFIAHRTTSNPDVLESLRHLQVLRRASSCKSCA